MDKKLMYFRQLAVVFLVFYYGQVSANQYSVHVGPNGYAPYSIVERNGGEIRYSGVMFDLLDAFDAANPEFERKYSVLTRKRANLQMANGAVVDLMFNSSLFLSDEILQHYQFTEPLIVTKDVVITSKDANFTYKKFTDLHGKRVGVIRGYSYGEFDKLIEDELIIDIPVDQHTQAIGMLEKGRIDAYFGNVFVSPHYMKQLGLQVSDFVFSDTPMYEFEFSFAVNKKKPEFYSKLNNFIVGAKADGSLDRILNEYLN